MRADAPPILAVDIGNTSVALGLWDGRRFARRERIDHRAVTAPGIRRAVKALTAGHPDVGASVASVAPSRAEAWMEVLHKRVRGPIVEVGHHSRLGVGIDVPRPETIGADRLANAAAAATGGLPAIVLDFGTALTFDVMLAKRGYVGGVIAPGLPLMFDYLADRTEQLPRLEPRTVRRAYGRTTEEAMLVGARDGYRGMVAGILDQLRGRKGLERARVMATGGYARWVVRDMPGVRIDPDLTLRGLVRIYGLENEGGPD
jgi:type III pantothenate kinase